MTTDGSRPLCVVDDDCSSREGIAGLLRSEGWPVVTFVSAEDFLERRDLSPACLILDVQLPGLSGVQLQQQLVKTAVDYPIIFVTGCGDIPTSVTAMKAGAVDFLTKPITDDKLIDLVRRSLASESNSQTSEDTFTAPNKPAPQRRSATLLVFAEDRDLQLRWRFDPTNGFDNLPGEVPGEAAVEGLTRSQQEELRRVKQLVLSTGRSERVHLRVVSDGAVRPVRFHYEPSLDAGGEVTGLIATVIDSSGPDNELVELARISAAREHMLGVLAHDLMSPVAAIRVLAGVLLGDDGIWEESRNIISRIDGSGRRVAEMVKTLLDFSGGRAALAMHLARTRTDLRELCCEVINEIAVTHPNRRMELSDAGAPSGLWDRNRLAQVISNLLCNALKHGAPDTPVRIALDGDSSSAWMDVINVGAPIPAQLMNQIFEPFRQGATSVGERPNGLGLGLFIVRQIVTAHGGSVTVQSGTNETRFRVQLPRT